MLNIIHDTILIGDVMNDNKKINYEDLNGAIKLSNKILKIVYIFIILGIIYAATIIGKEWGIIKFILNILRVLTPLFVGIVIAWMLDPLVKYLETKKIKRLFGIIIVYVLVLGIILFAFTEFIPILVNEINELIKSLPSIFGDIENWLNNLFNGLKSNNYFDFDTMKMNMANSISDLAKNLTITLPNKFISMINGLFSFFGTFSLGLLMGFYLLYDYKKVKGKVYNYIPNKFKEDYKELTTNINNSLFGFLKGTLLSSLIVFITSSIALSILGLKAPLLFALLAAILNIVPYVGPYLGIIPASIVGFTQSPAIGTLVIIVLGIVQLIEGNILNPLIMSKTMKMNPITILVSMLICGYLFGVWGVIIAAPLASVIKVIYQFILKKLNKKGEL